MHKNNAPKNAPKKVSMLDIIPKNMDWNKYSRLHDSFLEELSYEKQKFRHTDIWQLNYI